QTADALQFQRSGALPLWSFPLGVSLPKQVGSTGPMSAEVERLLASSSPFILMVGTVEPRKGHAQALAAMERLWVEGLDASLVIVGKQGWMVEELAKRLDSHRERRHRLHWLIGV